MALRLTIGFSDNPRVQPLKDGTVKPQNIELGFVTLDPSTLFQRNLFYDEFDVSEMSISETLLARERTDGKKWDWSASADLPESWPPLALSLREHGLGDRQVLPI